MKTFRLIGMALLAILISVNFEACSSEELEEPEKNEDGVVVGDKKLVQVKEYTDDNDSKTFDFSYDSKDRLISLIRTYSYSSSDIRKQNYIWGNNTIFEQTEDDNTTFNLENNLVKTIQESDDDDIISFLYNSSNQLIAEYGTNNIIGNWKRNYIWDNNKLLSYDDYKKYTYSGKTCKGYFPLIFPDDFSEGYDLFLAHPELNGMRTQQLPDKVTTNYDHVTYIENYSYTFYKEGYLETCTVDITEQYLTGETFNSKIIYTFKWE